MAEHMTEGECSEVAALFSIFANPTRLKLFCALQDGPKTVSELAEASGASMQNVSQHLRLMRDKGALTMKREGQFIYYSVTDERLFQAARLMRDALGDELRRKAGVARS